MDSDKIFPLLFSHGIKRRRYGFRSNIHASLDILLKWEAMDSENMFKLLFNIKMKSHGFKFMFNLNIRSYEFRSYIHTSL